MKTYPKILHHNSGIFGSQCFFFDKIDGSNIRVEWDQKLSKKSNFTGGFKKFGTRTQLISNMNSPFSDAVDIFMDKYSDGLDEIFSTNKLFQGSRRVTIYLEYFGENSFAGRHDPNEIKDLILIDVERFQKGFIPPRDFIDLFEDLGIPKVIYQGEYNEESINKVRNSDYNLKEGVVCKGVDNNKIWMTKIKTLDWLRRVKDKCGIEYLKEDFNNDNSLIKEFEESAKII